LKALVLSFLTNALSKSDPEIRKAVWDDHATAWRASTISYVYRKYLRDLLNESELAELHDAVRKHESQLRKFLETDRWSQSNHRLFHAEGLFDLCAAFPDVTNKEGTAIAVAKVREL